jgi:hypothetical protein
MDPRRTGRFASCTPRATGSSSRNAAAPERTTTALARARLDGNTLVDLEDVCVSNAWGEPGGH